MTEWRSSPHHEPQASKGRAGYEKEVSTPVESAFSTSRICTGPKSVPELVESTDATTQSATPVATAMAELLDGGRRPRSGREDIGEGTQVPDALWPARRRTSVFESIVKVTIAVDISGGESASSNRSPEDASASQPEAAAAGVH